MAQNYDVHYVTTGIGITAGTASIPLFHNIEANGCIRVVDAHMGAAAAGTVTANLCWLDTTGGTVQGTVATLGSASTVYAAKSVAGTGTVSTAVVAPGKWVGVTLGAGTAGAGQFVTVAYIKGQ